ncbi:MAG: RAD55 family ATPase, partial [Nitrososphaera sp.]
MGNNNNSQARQPVIPGKSQLIEKNKMPWGLFLLEGPAGVGKTMYCRQFIADGLGSGDHCIFISSNLTQSQFHDLFDPIDTGAKIKFTNPFQVAAAKPTASKLSAVIRDIRHFIEKTEDSDLEKRPSVRIVVDSLTHILLVHGEKILLKFTADLSTTIKDYPAMAICTLSTSDQHLQNYLSAFAQGIIEMKLEDHKG